MAAKSWDPLQPRLEPHAGAVPKIVYDVLEANSQTFKAGALVYLSSGAVAACADDPSKIWGIAMKDATNVTSGNVEIPVMIITPEDHVLIRVQSTAGTDALASTLTPGTRYGTELDANGVAYLLSAEVTTDNWIFIEPILDATGASTYTARVSLISTVSDAFVGTGA